MNTCCDIDVHFIDYFVDNKMASTLLVNNLIILVWLLVNT